MITIILSDGETKIENLEVNGTCLISSEDVADELLTDEMLSTITINEQEYKNITLARKWVDDDKTWIALRKKTQEEVYKERITELEAMNLEMSITLDSLMTDVLPAIMGTAE